MQVPAFVSLLLGFLAMKPLSIVSLLICLCAVRADSPPGAPAPRDKASAPTERVIEFNRDVRPILADACFACHGFDAKSRKAKLRLDTPEGAYALRKDIYAIKPGSLDESEAWKRVISPHADSVMPPPESNKTLTAAQKETLRLWIVQGAKYQK